MKSAALGEENFTEALYTEGEVTLRSKAVEALSDEFFQKVTPRKLSTMTLKKVSPIKH
jgi:hypothetical protein